MSGRSQRAEFLNRYQLAFTDSGAIEGALAKELFIALTRYAKDSGLPFSIRSGQQFYQRFANDLETIREAGFEVTIRNARQRERRYDIRRIAADGSQDSSVERIAEPAEKGSQSSPGENFTDRGFHQESFRQGTFHQPSY